MFAASLGALLVHSIDYAGTFPPCSLALEPALQNQARYVRDPNAWMLNNFVLPVEKFDAAVGGVSLFDRKHPLRISALGAKTGNADEFIGTLKIAAETIRSFFARHVDLVSIPQLEMPLAKMSILNRSRESDQFSRAWSYRRFGKLRSIRRRRRSHCWTSIIQAQTGARLATNCEPGVSLSMRFRPHPK
jgi:hypothetical protein